MDDDTDDIVGGLNDVLTKDGQNTPTAVLPMGGFRHTGVQNAQARTDYAAAGQVQDSAFIWGGITGGSANAQTLGPSPVIAALVDGQVFNFRAAFTNTGATTFSVSGLPTHPVTSGGTALVGGEIVEGANGTVIWNNTSSRFELVTIPSFRSIHTQKFTTSGTYTPTAGLIYADITCVGGGGGGGGTVTGPASTLAIAGGGGGGEVSKKRVTAADIGSSQPVTIGAAGSAGAAGNNNGGAGGDSSVGSLSIAKGGSGGAGQAGADIGGAAAGGTGGTGDETFDGEASEGRAAQSSIFPFGAGGDAALGYGFGGAPRYSTGAGFAGTGFGGGGAGGASFNSGGAEPGGVGTPGYAVIVEYCNP